MKHQNCFRNLPIKDILAPPTFCFLPLPHWSLWQCVTHSEVIRGLNVCVSIKVFNQYNGTVASLSLKSTASNASLTPTKYSKTRCVGFTFARIRVRLDRSHGEPGLDGRKCCYQVELSRATEWRVCLCARACSTWDLVGLQCLGSMEEGKRKSVTTYIK